MADEMLPLHLFALGAPEARLGEKLLVFPTRKTLALLFYLAIETGLQPREYLATLLWPEASPERSYASLRNTLGHLQAVLRQASSQVQTAYLHITHDSLGLNPDAETHLDLHVVDQAYALARADRSSRTLMVGSESLPVLQMAAHKQRGDFLAGFSLGDAPGFDDWAAIQREIWRRRLGLILDRLSEIQFANGEFSGATDAASRWIALDALNEVAYRRKMRAHFAAGERGQALETYDACRAVLTTELGIEPEPDTVALAERIRMQSTQHRSTPQPNLVETPVMFLENLFAGRTNEYQSLVDSYARASEGQPQLVVLRGEAGIGKTRLARKFLTWANAQGAELLQGGAYESGVHLPFQPLIEALRMRFAHENAIKDLLGEPWWRPLSQLLPEFGQHDPGLESVAEEQPGLKAEGSQSQLFEPFTQLTLSLANQAPLVLFMDDLQWADSATLDMLQYTLRRWIGNATPAANTRILLLVSLRSEALRPMNLSEQAGSPYSLGQWLTRVGRELTTFHIELEPLGERETVQMVLSILSPPAADFARWVYNETRGQPFYLIETLKDLLERRVLHAKWHSGGRWTFAVDADHNLGQTVRVPSTIHAVIRSRLHRLSPRASSLLAGAAVLDWQITFKRLCAISNTTEDKVLPALDELISGRLLLEAAQPSKISAYTFTNDMLRDVVYTEAGDARRRLFHRRALDILSAEGGAAAILAHHALAAGLAQDAFLHSLAAGRESLRLSAVSEAVVHLERARQFVQEASQPEIPGDADIRDLYTQLGRAYALTGQTEKYLALEAERNRFWLARKL